MDVRNNNFLEFHGMLTPLTNLPTLPKNDGFMKVVATGSFFRASVIFIAP